MKLASSKLIDLSRALLREAEQAEQDSWFDVGGRINLFAEMANGIKKYGNLPSTVTASDSFNDQRTISQGGVNAGSVVSSPFIAPGLWRFTGFLRVAFIGTVNINNFTQLGIQDTGPGAGVILLSTVYNVLTPLTVDTRFDLLVPVVNPIIPQFQLASPATVAGDSILCTYNVTAHRIV